MYSNILQFTVGITGDTLSVIPVFHWKMNSNSQLIKSAAIFQTFHHGIIEVNYYQFLNRIQNIQLVSPKKLF